MSELIMRDPREVTSRENAHEWSIQNQFIFVGYRKNFSSIRLIFRSLFIKHNELMNVWTHLLGALFFLLSLIYVYIHFPDTKELYHQLKEDLKALNNTLSVDKTYERAWYALKKELRDLNFPNKIAKKVINADALKSLALDFSNRIKTGKDFKYLSSDQSDVIGIFSNFTNIFFDKISSVISKNYTNNSIDFYVRNISAFEVETFPIIVYILSALTCLMCSTIYHLFCDMNPAISIKLRHFDYAGISILISGSAFAIIYYSLYCRTVLVTFYSTCSFSFSFAVFVISLGDFIHRHENNMKKSLLYGGLGLLNIFPIVHMFYLCAYPAPESNDLPFNIGLVYMLASGVCYLLGLFIYTHKFPERYYPLIFDIWMNSHVIWHLCVFAGALLHFIALILVYRIRSLNPCHEY